MNWYTKFLAALALVVSLAAHAAQPSPQDLNLMAASLKVAETYKQGGVSGVFNEMRQCYAGLKQKQPVTAKDIEFCVALDMSAVLTDYTMSQNSGFPRDPRFMDDMASNRMHAILMNFNLSKGVADTQDYLAARHERVQKYTGQAITLVANGPGGASNAVNTDACVSSKMVAWDKKRAADIRQWCADLEKKGQECRISEGADADARNDAVQKLRAECSKAAH